MLQNLMLDGANKSFNRITIDGDTSTNDCCMLIATGKAALPEITRAEGELFAKLKQAVFEVCMDVAQAIVRDGEGATKFVTVEVNGGGNHQECLDVGYTVAHSPLIKTALFCSDPNWGRILAAVGRRRAEPGREQDRRVPRRRVHRQPWRPRRDLHRSPGLGGDAAGRDHHPYRTGPRRLQRNHLDHRPVARVREDQRRVPHLIKG
jgi:hypothetical protein